LIACALTAVAIANVTPNRADDHARPSGPPAITLIAGVPLQQARCEQWIAGSSGERAAVVDLLAKVAGGASTTGGYGATLSPGATRDLFTRTCAAPFARGFLLYELYNRRAAFR
jgi:hypothetical protein